MPRRLLVALIVCTAAASAACSLDEAELFDAGATQITADVDQLRVLSYDDDPATDRWVDVVSPDTAVFEEGDSFREADSRSADDDQPAEDRRLLTGVAPGRTLLVQFDEVDDELLVWDLVVGDPGQTFSDGTDIARSGRTTSVEAGARFAVVRSGSDGPSDAVFTTGDAPIVELVGRHEPGDGADLYVDVFATLGRGTVELVYGDDTFPIEIS